MPRSFARPMLALFATLALAVALVMPAPAVAQAAPGANAEAHAGLLKAVQGDVRLQAAGSSASTPARVGDAVNAGQRIVTGAESGASVVLRDGTTLVIGPQSTFDLQAFGYDLHTHDGNVLGKLLRGTLRMVTGLIGRVRPEAIRIDTPTATIGIRGTDFIVNASDTR